jgi:hypothetical protein
MGYAFYRRLTATRTSTAPPQIAATASHSGPVSPLALFKLLHPKIFLVIL